MALRIPTKVLEDKFKLEDFQKDYLELLELLHLSTAQPVTVNITGRSEMEFIYENGTRKTYRFTKSNNVITKIINVSDNKVTIVNNY